MDDEIIVEWHCSDCDDYHSAKFTGHNANNAAIVLFSVMKRHGVRVYLNGADITNLFQMQHNI